MTPRRLINHWATGPLLLTLLAADLWWFGWHTRGYDDRSEVADLLIDAFTSDEGSGCGGGPPKILTWRDGDCRLFGYSGDLSHRPARQDPPDSTVSIAWGRCSWGIIAPCQREDWVLFYNHTDYPPDHLPSSLQVIGAFAEARLRPGNVLPIEVIENPPRELPSHRKNVVWAGVVHDAVVLPAWVAALALLVCLPGRYVRWAYARCVLTRCRGCGYDTASLRLAGVTRCPECGQYEAQ